MLLCRLNHSRYIPMANRALPNEEQVSSLDCTRVVLDDDAFSTVSAPDIGKEFHSDF